MTTSEISLLRLYTDDRDDGTHPLFLEDNELQDLLDLVDGDIHGAAVKVWLMKAARVHEWYQASLDGSFLSREQVFEHCSKMADYHKQYAVGQIVTVRMENTFSETATLGSFEF